MKKKTISQIGNIFLEYNKITNTNTVRRNFDFVFSMNYFTCKKEDRELCKEIVGEILLYVENQNLYIKEKEEMSRNYYNSIERSIEIDLYTKIKKLIYFEKNKDFIESLEMILLNVFRESVIKDVNDNFDKRFEKIKENINLRYNKIYRLYKKREQLINGVKINNLETEVPEIMDILNELDEMFEDGRDIDYY